VIGVGRVIGVLTTQSPLSTGESVLIGLIVTILLWLPVLPRVAPSNLAGMSHEGRRAILYFFIGLTITELFMGRSRSRTSIGGEAVRVASAVLLGYFGASLFGLGAAWLISLHRPLTFAWMAFVVIGVLMYLTGTSFGWTSVPIAAGLTYVVLRFQHVRVEEITEYVIAWLLLSLGFRLALGHALRVIAWGTPDMFHRLHRVFVALLWLAGALVALAVGGNLLVSS
jgi:hypothetical protein